MERACNTANLQGKADQIKTRKEIRRGEKEQKQVLGTKSSDR